MKIYATTERLILRELLPSDDEAMFEMESDPEVHRYLGNRPKQTIEEVREVIALIRQQYIDNGIARWAAVEKATGEFVGWTGLKHIKVPENGHDDFHDVGYRLLRKHWYKGYATESTKASLRYAFEEMGLQEVIGTANVENTRSRKALEKCGLKWVNTFMYNNEILCDWLSITRPDWEAFHKAR